MGRKAWRSEQTGNWLEKWLDMQYTLDSLCLHSEALQASEDDHHLCMKCMDLNSRLDTFVKVLINVLIIMTV